MCPKANERYRPSSATDTRYRPSSASPPDPDAACSEGIQTTTEQSELTGTKTESTEVPTGPKLTPGNPNASEKSSSKITKLTDPLVQSLRENPIGFGSSRGYIAEIPKFPSNEQNPKFPDASTAYPRDELDDLIDQAAVAFSQCDGDWEAFFASQRDPRGDWGQVEDLQHPAAHLLTHYKKRGVPIETTTPAWTQGQREAALQRGPHKSAQDHIEFLREEYTDMIKKGHWILLPADLVKHMPWLRLSPLGVVPQRERRPRTISDYSYFLVNADTLKLAPPEAMQFGKALARLLQTIHASNPRFGPVYLSKIDVADAFYRIGLRPRDAVKLGVLFPSREGERQLIGIPLVLPMGWAESPPAFCAATETAADLANAALDAPSNLDNKPHRFDKVSETTHPPIPSAPAPVTLSDMAPPVPTATSHIGKLKRPVRGWDVYVDDFLGHVQGNKWKRRAVKRALLHSLDQVFRPLDDTDNPSRQEPASIKKFLKGDAWWTTRKIMLGWIIDTIRRTIELPPHRILRLREILGSVSPLQTKISVKHWHKIIGELRSMAIAIPGAQGMFSLLQEAFRHVETTRPRIRLTMYQLDE